MQDLAATKRREMPRELGGTPASELDVFDRGACALIEPTAREDDARHTEDDRQQVVEVVRDPRGQPTDDLHLLRLAQLILESASRGDVTPNGREAERLGGDRIGDEERRREDVDELARGEIHELPFALPVAGGEHRGQLDFE